MPPLFIEDKLVDFEEDHGENRLLIKHTQYIPDDYISELKKEKIDADHDRSGEFFKLAEIPVIFIERWMREGFDINRASAKEIVKKLRQDQLDAFITTNKRI